MGNMRHHELQISHDAANLPNAANLDAAHGQGHVTEATDLELPETATTVAAARMGARFEAPPAQPTTEDRNFGMISSPSVAFASFMFIGIITARTLETPGGVAAGYGAQMDQVRRVGISWEQINMLRGNCMGLMQGILNLKLCYFNIYQLSSSLPCLHFRFWIS